MINQLLQQPNFRDYFGRWTPPAIRNLDVVNDANCFRPSYYAAPKFSERTIPDRGYVQTQLSFPVGGYILAMSQAGDGPLFQVMVTDLSLNRPLFNAPIETTAISGVFYTLPDLYPIRGNGNFRVEFWNSVAGVGDIVAEVVFCIVEPKGL